MNVIDNLRKQIQQSNLLFIDQSLHYKFTILRKEEEAARAATITTFITFIGFENLKAIVIRINRFNNFIIGNSISISNITKYLW
jgi:hypothetical protein